MQQKKISDKNKFVIILVITCMFLIITNIVSPIYGYFESESIYGFYAGFGFISFCIIITIAKIFQRYLARDEDYYRPFSIDDEIYHPPIQEEHEEYEDEYL